jgi:cell division protein DivIC
MKLKKASLITKIVIIALFVYAAVTIVSLMGKTAQQNAESEALRQEAADLEIHNAELEYAIDNSTDDDVIADIAHKELGLVASDEQVFYDSND